jgi:hypothetical protein
LGLYSEKGLANGKTFLLPFLKFQMQKFAYENILSVYLGNKSNHPMKKYSFILVLIFGSTFAFHAVAARSAERERSSEKGSKTELANDNPAMITLKPFVSEGLESTENPAYFSDYTPAHDTTFAPWTFTEEAVEILDHYLPFIFRTKKSAAIEELRVVLSINEFGKLTGFRILNEGADKGLKERMGHVLRKLPAAVPVPGFQTYQPMEFQLVMAY